ncbi:hypothetical protein TVAG_489180 [Trichomonas vaginalis G3]|uniref:Uncharacterized protein n=1 Tax=Trichomonas vaginalis (strain ATCC PRA-98 / G3) TaxID=412133 RepID=A2EVC8_TRIV3|nr:zebrafish ch211-108c17.2-related family [Trichomonas vaginalis G3]EAY03374.1 hypothetical protein TVAG_489180 [Trichomonas vaginalis G3]KAI5538096.1 zebrafish ch211-108c17.2-related family [Trichomonas vaginalis G3]|eukprot:XP_001315597.1 hypothetical protein [Trichomonas vaginalis G3]
MLAWNSITPPSKSTYYRNLHRVENAICRMAEESCKHYWDAMDHNTIIAFDGSWSQRRNAFHCITDFIDTKNRKIVYFSIKEKNNHKLFGNFAGASNGMEVSGVKDFVKYAKYDKRISGFCHDRDAKSSNVFANSQWNIPEYIDKNHMTKSFDKIFKEVNSKYQRKLFGLRARLRNYLNVLYYLDESVDEKKKHWMNSLNHYCGDHSECLHSREDNKSKIKSKKKKTREFVWD